MWQITKDKFATPDEEESRVGLQEQHSRISNVDYVLGFESEPLPSHHTRKTEAQSVTAIELPKIKFRTKDDDGFVYYEGWLHDDDDCANQEAALKFAETDAGCTTIEVYRNGEWVIEIG